MTFRCGRLCTVDYAPGLLGARGRRFFFNFSKNIFFQKFFPKIFFQRYFLQKNFFFQNNFFQKKYFVLNNSFFNVFISKTFFSNESFFKKKQKTTSFKQKSFILNDNVQVKKNRQNKNSTKKSGYRKNPSSDWLGKDR